MAYLRYLQKLVDPVSTSGGIIFVVTADAEENLDPIRTTSGYTGMMMSDRMNRP